MRTVPLALLAVLATTCGPGDPSNPAKLYLVLDGSETEVKLSPDEPPPF